MNNTKQMLQDLSATFELVKTFDFQAGPIAGATYLRNADRYLTLANILSQSDELRATSPTLIPSILKMSDQIRSFRDEVDRFIQNSADFQETLYSLPKVPICLDGNAAPTGWVVDDSDIICSPFTGKSITERLGSFISIDVETSGLDPVRNEILELAAVRFLGFRPVECFNTFIHPHYGLNPKAAAVNHITEDMVRDAPTIESVRASFKHFIGDKGSIVGHNISFDLRFLYASGCLNYPSNNLFFDTLKQSRKKYKFDSYRLDYLDRAVLRISRDDAHSALSDALLAGLLFKNLCR